MYRPIKLTLVVAAAGLLGLPNAFASQSHHRLHRPTHHYAQSPTYWSPHAYNPYQNPDGTYNSAADYSRDFWGVPCGISCTRDAEQRWARYYTSHPVPYGP